MNRTDFAAFVGPPVLHAYETRTMVEQIGPLGFLALATRPRNGALPNREAGGLPLSQAAISHRLQ